MLRVNQLTGFGGQAGPQLLITSSPNQSNTNTPNFPIDLGPPGVKQVLAVFACSNDSVGNDPWVWGTGNISGEAFTFVFPSGDETAGTGISFTGGVTVRSLQTSLSGIQTVVMPIVGYAGTMANNRMLALVTRGFSATPKSHDRGENEVVGDGNNFTLNTSDARVVIGACVGFGSGPGNMTGPGSPITAVSGTRLALGYDLLPAKGTSDVYAFSGSKYVIAGAAFG